MGCTQSTATSTNSANDNKKLLDIGTNLIVTKQTNFREDYDIVKRIGEGSISNIYKVRAKSASVDIEKDKLYALKEIDISLVKPEFMEEMRNEIALMRSITHPNILKIYEVYDDDNRRGRMSIVMELCSGGDLNTRVPYTEQQAKTSVAKLLEAVNYLHKHGIVHRDLKVRFACLIYHVPGFCADP
jgi:serine/threonine protein kinase